MRKLLLAVAILAGLVLAGIVALPFLVPKDTLVARLEREIESRTGREFAIGGAVEVSAIPALAVSLGDVRFAGVDGGADLVRLGRLDLRLQLWPLLSGEARIDRFVLVEPVIALEVDRRGRGNWEIGGAAAPGAASPGTSGPGASGPGGSGPAGALEQLVLGDVEIVGGRLTYTDAAAGTTRTVEDLDAVVRLPGLESPAALEASFALDRRPVRLEATLAPARVLIDGGTARTDLALAAGDATVRFDGTVELPAGAGEPTAAGALSVAVPSLPDLLAWLGGGKAPELPVRTLDITGQVKGSATRVAVTDLALKAGDLAATGSLAVGVSGPRPSLSGKLAVARLDLTPFLPPPAQAPSAVAPPADPNAPPPPPPEPWSRDPIDLSALKTADLDLDIAVDGVVLDGVEAGPTELAIDLKNGRLAASLAETGLFGGKVGGRAMVDAAAATPTIGVALTATGVQAEPLLLRFAQSGRLTGTLAGGLDLRATGASPFDLVQTVDGRVEAVFRDGAIRGINLANLVRSVTGRPADGPQQTDFAELGASFAIADGLASTDDLRLLAPLLRVEGKGTVALPAQQVDLRIVPRLVASIEGQGAARSDQAGLSVPIFVRGTFADLRFVPDIAGLARQAIEDPAALRGQVQGAKDALKGLTEGAAPEKAVEGVLRGLLGGRGQPTPEPPETQPSEAQPSEAQPAPAQAPTPSPPPPP